MRPLDDLLEAQGDVDWQPSAIVAINDQDVVEFLNRFAAQNVLGAIEPHADWNNLMTSAASDIQLVPSTFEGLSLFYPGPNVTFRFENGTVLFDQPWLAQWSPYIDPSEIPSLLTGQQLYDWFVLGIDSTEADATRGSLPSETSTASKLRRRRQAASSTSAPDTSQPSAWLNLWNYVIDALYRNPSLCVATSTTPPPRPPPSTPGGLVMKVLMPSPPPSRKTKRSFTIPGASHLHKPHRRFIQPRNNETPHLAKRRKPTPCEKCPTGETCYSLDSCRLDPASDKAVCKIPCSVASNGSLKCPYNEVCIHSSDSTKSACVKLSEAKSCRGVLGSEQENGHFDEPPDVTRSLPYKWSPACRGGR